MRTSRHSDNAPVAERMTRLEFSRGVERTKRRMIAEFMVILCVIFGAMGLLAWISDGAKDDSVSTWQQTLWVLLPIAGLGAVASVYSYLVWGSKIRCLQCGHDLAIIPDGDLCVVAGRCPGCGVDLFDDEDPTNSPSAVAGSLPLINRADIEEADRLARNGARFRPRVWQLSGVSLVIAGAIIGWWLIVSGTIDTDAVWAPFVAPMLAMPGIFLTKLFLLIEARRRGSIPCPHCSEPISAHDSAFRTGGCSRCGRDAVRDPFPGLASSRRPQSEALWPVAEFHNLARTANRSMPIGISIGGAVMFLWLFLFKVLIDSKAPSLAITQVAKSVGFFGGAAFLLLGTILLWHRRCTRRLRCHECQGDLTMSPALVISSHRCCHCGVEVLSPPDTPPALATSDSP